MKANISIHNSSKVLPITDNNMITNMNAITMNNFTNTLETRLTENDHRLIPPTKSDENSSE
ncbi:hypothetical protein RND71_025280 [Anisodus tanguticus]|uniref:Uncharacterized protein n=1 Tax=Anisodus tanguticus TaxID=243964 RepID=A0AAE1RPN8_9SOLA|nr:hypothetical protein RND71_025280 [Anisodus tanguticus]